MAHRLDQQVAIVTGASRGIGRAIAEQAAARGMKLVLAWLIGRPAIRPWVARLYHWRVNRRLVWSGRL